MTDWTLAGDYFEACNCETACPCVFLSSPTEGECTALVAWHIDKGKYGGTQLDGLNVALAVHSPGNMAKSKWKIAAYFDEKATPEQNDALHAIFSGKAGGHPAVLASFIGEIVGAKNVAMRYEKKGKHRSLTIPDIAEAAIDMIEGRGGKPVEIENHPLCISPGVPATVGRSEKLRYADFGMVWTLSGRNGFTSSFAYQSA